MYLKYYFSLLSSIPIFYLKYTRNMTKGWRESGSYSELSLFSKQCALYEMWDKFTTGI